MFDYRAPANQGAFVTDPATPAVATIAAWWSADFLLQSRGQAIGKGDPTPEGRAKCAGHVATLTAAHLAAMAAVLPAGRMHPVSALAAVAVNSASHYWIDRRSTLEGLVRFSEPWLGKGDFYDTESGRMHMDQAAHMAWVLPVSLVSAMRPRYAVAASAVCGAALAGLHAVSRVGLGKSRLVFRVAPKRHM